MSHPEWVFGDPYPRRPAVPPAGRETTAAHGEPAPGPSPPAPSEGRPAEPPGPSPSPPDPCLSAAPELVPAAAGGPARGEDTVDSGAPGPPADQAAGRETTAAHGEPALGPSSPAPSEGRSAGAETRLFSTRPNDSGLGTPHAWPKERRRLALDEAAAWRPSLRPEEETEAEVVAEEADASDTRLWPSAVRRLGQGAALVLIALFALYVAAQVTTTLANLAHLPGWLDLMILPVVVLPLVIVGWFTWKLVHLFLSLKPNRPIRLAALEQLRERTKLRAAAEKKTREAQERLLAYLKAFPLDKKHERRWAALECRPEEIAGLRAVRDRLMAAGLRPTAEQWIQDFVDQFLKPLNEVAKRRVWFYGRRVGVATASAPIPLMDTLIVLSHSLAMIVDLCWIYNLRTGGGATLVVLVRSVAHSYLAGQMQDLTEAGHEAIGGHIQDMIGQMGSKLVGFFSKRIAEGTANGVLLWHLGRSAIRLLKPVQ